MSDDTMQLEEVNQPESTTGKTQEEIPNEWASLDGKSQDRFQALANKKREAEESSSKERKQREKLEIELKVLKESKTQDNRIPMPRTNKMTSEEEVAYKRLTDLGVANEDYVNKRVDEKIRVIEDRLYFDNLHSRLEGEVGSQKGLPKYDRPEIEAYMKERQIYDPKAAYRDLYHDEIVAHEAAKLTSKKTKTTKTESTNSRISQTQPWDRDSLAKRLREPDGVQFFRKNREKILKLQGMLK